jgi:hypothetical protein
MITSQYARSCTNLSSNQIYISSANEWAIFAWILAATAMAATIQVRGDVTVRGNGRAALRRPAVEIKKPHRRVPFCLLEFENGSFSFRI